MSKSPDHLPNNPRAQQNPNAYPPTQPRDVGASELFLRSWNSPSYLATYSLPLSVSAVQLFLAISDFGELSRAASRRFK